MKRWLILTSVLSLLLTVIVACVTEPISGKRVLILTSESQENELGLQAYREILAKEPRSTNRYFQELVDRVGRNLATAADKPDYDWEFTVIESKQQNAFCLPGGKVAVYTGILPVAANEAGLATVLGHEIAHATARHAGQRLTEGKLAQLGFSVLSGFIGEDGSLKQRLIMGALGVGYLFGRSLPFSRDQEADADSIGLVYMAQAGYDPAEAPRFWQRFMQAHQGGQVPAFLSDHPADEDRVRALQQELPRASAAYQKAPQHYGLGTTIHSWE